MWHAWVVMQMQGTRTGPTVSVNEEIVIVNRFVWGFQQA